MTGAPPAPSGPTLRQREARLGWALVSPAVVIVLLLVVFPILWNLTLSVQRLRLIDLQQISFLDFDATMANFERVTGQRDFWEVVRTTIVYTFFSTVLSLALGLWAAMVVKKAFIGRSLVRGIMLAPYVAPIIAVTFVWKIMLNPTFGIANEWLSAVGFDRVDFLGQRDFRIGWFGFEMTLPLALTVVILFEAWRYFPFAFLFILARLQSIPGELNEAALVDGATVSQQFRYVTLPQLGSVMSVLFVLRFIYTFNKFDDIWLLTGGGAGTDVITVRIFNWLFGRGDIGAAAALSLVLAAILIVLLTIYFKFFHQEEEL